MQTAVQLLGERLPLAAIAAFEAAEQTGADADLCAAGRWQAHMLLGNFRKAWQESDAIRLRGADDPHRFWNGEDLHGKRLMLRCLHGLGDAVQMLRYLPMLQARCSEVIVEVSPRMLPLARYFAGAGRVITWGVDAPRELPGWDVQVEVMELPYVFRSEQASLPVAVSYLRAPEQQTPTPLRQTAKLPRVGLVWAASEWDPTRRLPMECLARITATAGIEFWNLQGGEEHSRSRHEAALLGAIDAASFGDGLVQLASTIAKLDLVITVDTLAAHLAGALGRPAWLLLQHRADWRWMVECTDSPWYPSLTLFRQPAPGDWDTPTTSICEALLKLSRNSGVT